HLQHHEYRGKWSSQESGKENAHAYQSVRAKRAGKRREEEFFKHANRRPQHCTDEEGRREHAARGPTGKRERGRDDLEECEQKQHFKDELSVHRLIDGAVACSHNLWQAEVAYSA